MSERFTSEGAAWRRLLDRASAPYRGAGRFAWHFARGKLGHDPVFRHLLGVESDIGPFWARTRADAARRWWARYGTRLRWSELAGHFVVR